MYITFVELLLFTNILRVLYPLMVSIITRVSSCGCLIPFTSLLEKTNVVIPITMMFCYWVFDMNTVYLPLDCLSQVLIWSPNNRPSNDRPYFSHDLLRIVPIFFLMVINGLLFCSLVSLIIFLDKFLKFSPLDQLLYLLFQISALISIMTMVLVEAAVFLYISPFWVRD